MATSVLVVDDSDFFRRRIRDILARFPDFHVIGEAANGHDAVRATHELHPDVITLDYEMPGLNGIAALAEIRRESSVPVLMLSSLTWDGARVTIQALESGADDFLIKSAMTNVGESRQPMLIEKLRALVSKKNPHDMQPAEPVVVAVPDHIDNTGHRAPAVHQQQARIMPAPVPGPSVPHREPVRAPVSAPLPMARRTLAVRPSLLLIGTSTGGPLAVRVILDELPADFSLPVIIIQHMPARFTSAFADRLDATCAITVREASDGDVLKPGLVYIAPGGKQLLLDEQDHSVIRIIDDESDMLYRPCIDVTFGSAARAWPGAVLAVVLTGMGSDGTRGAKMLHQTQSRIWVQDDASCVVAGMPASVRKANLADETILLSEMGARLRALSS